MERKNIKLGEKRLRTSSWRRKGVSIITQVIIEILALSLAENGVIFRYNHLCGGEIFKAARDGNIRNRDMIGRILRCTIRDFNDGFRSFKLH